MPGTNEKRLRASAPLGWRYPVLLWTTTITVAPMLMLFSGLATQPTSFDGTEFGLLPLFFAFGAVYSLPALLLLLMVFYVLRRQAWPAWKLKWALIVTSIGGMWIILSLLGGSLIPSLRVFYGAVILVAGILLPLRREV